jgi:hypothetical protein
VSRDAAPPKRGRGAREVFVAVAVAFARIFGSSYDPDGARRSREASRGAATRSVDPQGTDRVPPEEPE